MAATGRGTQQTWLASSQPPGACGEKRRLKTYLQPPPGSKRPAIEHVLVILHELIGLSFWVAPVGQNGDLRSGNF